MKIIGFSVVAKNTNFQFGTHRSWSVYEFGESGAKEQAQECINLSKKMYPNNEFRIMNLYGLLNE